MDVFLMVIVVLNVCCASWFSFREDWDRVKVSLLWAIFLGIMMLVFK